MKAGHILSKLTMILSFTLQSSIKYYCSSGMSVSGHKTTIVFQGTVTRREDRGKARVKNTQT